MGDGRVALILDVLGLAHRSRVLSNSHDRIMKDSTDEADKQSLQAETLLLFADESASRMAIPLARASRLEEFAQAAIEEVGGHEVVQYRGEIMPLIRIDDVIQDRRRSSRGLEEVPDAHQQALQVVVFACDGRNVGLVIGKVLDIIAEGTGAMSPASREGVRGCAVIQSKVTELLDLEFIARRGLSDIPGPRQPVNATSEV